MSVGGGVTLSSFSIMSK